MGAASANHETVVQRLLHHGANILDRNTDERNAFEQAASLGHVKVIETMIQDGQIHLQSELGQAALKEAVTEGQETMVKVLLNHGVRVNAPEDEDEETALI